MITEIVNLTLNFVSHVSASLRKSHRIAAQDLPPRPMMIFPTFIARWILHVSREPTVARERNLPCRCNRRGKLHVMDVLSGVRRSAEIYRSYYAVEIQLVAFITSNVSDKVKPNAGDYARWGTYARRRFSFPRMSAESTRINIPGGKSPNLAFASRDYGAN